MRPKKTHRIVVDGKTIARRRTARGVAGAVVFDFPVPVGRVAKDGGVFKKGEMIYRPEPRVLRWVKPKAAEKTSGRGVKAIEKQVAAMNRRGPLKNVRFVKTA
jgi:hypothetical protein